MIEAKPKGLYEKIQGVRVELSKSNIKESGKIGGRSGYLNLEDFLPDLNRL
ncbi:MAG: hypothetical protein LBK70_00445 [Clostridiales bacterium]|jgi:hypothetical protein|nr:hypothetical protein [Clostridiales bacterium]